MSFEDGRVDLVTKKIDEEGVAFCKHLIRSMLYQYGYVTILKAFISSINTYEREMECGPNGSMGFAPEWMSEYYASIVSDLEVQLAAMMHFSYKFFNEPVDARAPKLSEIIAEYRKK